MVNALSHSSSFFAGWVYFGVYCKRYGRSFALLYLPYFSELWKSPLGAKPLATSISSMMPLCRSEATSRDPSGGAAVGEVESPARKTSHPVKRHDSDYGRVVPNDEGNATWRHE